MKVATVIVTALICFVGLHLLDREILHIFSGADKLVVNSENLKQSNELNIISITANIKNNNLNYPTSEPSIQTKILTTNNPVIEITLPPKKKIEEVPTDNNNANSTSHRVVKGSNIKCQSYENKTLIDPENMYDRNITLLVSFPGSGNTWTRVLIETITGAYTGSVYLNDNDLSQVFYTEVRCGLRMAAIKGHPTNFERCNDYLCLVRGKHEVRKCRKGMIYNWKRFIFIARDPMRSIFSEFQRLTSGKHDGSVIKVTPAFSESFVSIANILADDIAIDWENKIFPMRQLHEPLDFLTIKYENLLDKNLRENEIRPVPKFLKFPYEPDRIPCAFDLSEKPSGIHRKSTLSYHSLIGDNQTLACELWSKIKYFSDNFSYPYPFPKFKCD